jgi:GAF domain-containing protein
MEVLDAFSRQAAIALRNARLLTSEHEQRILAEGLRDVAAALTSTLDLTEVTERILTNINRVVEHDAANVMLIEDDTLHIVRSRGQPLAGLRASEWRQPLKLFKILEQVTHTGRAIAVPNTDAEPLWIQRPESSWIKSYATAPIRSRGRVIGFVNVSSKQPGFFTQAHASLLQAFADQASIAMDNASLFQSTRAVATETNTLLRALAPLFAAGADLATVVEEIVHAVVGEFSQSHCGLMLVDQERQTLSVFREAGDIRLGPHTLLLDGPGLTVAAFNSGEMIYVPDVSKDERYFAGSESIKSELVIPLIAGGKAIGVLNLESPNLDAFDEASHRMVSAFAERAAWVLANSQLFEATRVSARQMTLLNEITQVALSGGDLNVVLGEVVRRVAELIDADGCYMTRWEEATQQTIPLMAYGMNAEKYNGDIPEPGEKNLTYALMLEGRPIPIEDTYNSPYLPRHIAKLFPTRSLLGVPLQLDGQKLGALLVGFNQPYQFTSKEIQVVQQAGGQIALILARMNALMAAQARAEESERLRQASAALTTTLDVQEVAQLIIDHMGSLVQYHTAIVYQYHEDGLKAIAYHNAPSGEELLEIQFPLDDQLLVDVVRSGGALPLDDAQTDPRYKNWGGTENIHSWLGLPLMAGNEVVGTINLGRLEVKPFNANEMALLYKMRFCMPGSSSWRLPTRLPGCITGAVSLSWLAMNWSEAAGSIARWR